MAKRLSKAQLGALRWLAAHNGRGQLDRYGNVVAADGDKSGRIAATWLRLMISGHCAPHIVPGSIGITMTGLEAIR